MALTVVERLFALEYPHQDLHPEFFLRREA